MNDVQCIINMKHLQDISTSLYDLCTFYHKHETPKRRKYFIV